MTSPLRIGLAQYDIAWEDRDANLSYLQNLLNISEELDLLILPEMWSTGFSMRPEVIAESTSGPALAWMVHHAQKLKLAIAGSISVKDGNKYYNRWYCVHPNGHIDQYDKRHLFSYGKEDLHYAPGHSRIVVDIKGWKIMPIVCYDLRFPVWCRNDLDYDLMIVVANWPTPRIHHWDALLKARAIENQCYIAAVNRVGTDGNGLQYPGHSCGIDMNGNVIIEMGEVAGIGSFDVDQETLTQYRHHFRFLQDRDSFEL